ncbi:MAG: hypothetical protein MSG78_06400, partial [Clostridiales bacterium]|nr:hypothetical protein [Clostridiales bacterium]
MMIPTPLNIRNLRLINSLSSKPLSNRTGSSFFSGKISLQNLLKEKRIMMNLQTYFTRTQINLQEVSQIWMQKIFPHLPGNFESLAKQSGALQRKRGFSSALDVLKLFFLYAVSGLSFRMLAAAAQGLQISQISDTAWRKKFSQSIPFLHEVLQELLSPLFLPSPSLFSKEKNVLLVDASLIRQ